MNDYIYDIETYPNVFLMGVEHAHLPIAWSFEISPWYNGSAQIVELVNTLRSQGARMVGFNNLGFDYPILHMLLKMGNADAATLYQKAQAIISSQGEDDGRWVHDVKPTDRLVEQIDLFRIHHFDNRARSTSLKVLAFNMRRPNISDLPFPVGSMLTQDQVTVLRQYNREDISVTKDFYHESADMIRFREELTAKYQRDFMNHNDTKIGKDYFVMQLEASGVECYDYSPQKGRTPRQTKRPSIALKDAILPWISFEHPEFRRILEWFKGQTITETKNVFKDIVATVDGFDFVFGLGGIHGSVEKKTVVSNEDYVIVDLDVSSYYPNLAIQNRLYPAHLGEKFCDIYQSLYEQRKQYKKGSAENAMLKLALNGTYGDSNQKFSVFYDPLFTMSITINGQLLLCMLAERLMKIPGLQMLQCNTDGLTVRVPRGLGGEMRDKCNTWMQETKLQLEDAVYDVMFIADVNNYIARRTDGTIKRKGRYEYDLEWYQNHGALVIPRVAEKVLLEGAPIRETLEEWPDLMDFMLRVKVPRNSYLSIEHGGKEVQLQNTTRYYVARNGGRLFKWLTPLKDNLNWRRIGVEAGWGVQVCNELRDDTYGLARDIDYYEREVEKLCLPLM